MRKLNLVALGTVLCTIFGLIVNGTAFLSLDRSAGSQDVRSLDSRINMLEQRLYSIQTSVSRLEQTAISQRSSGPRETVRDHEINLLSQEIQKLILRVEEAECGLLKLDERTRRGDRSTTDPCRMNPNSPLQLRRQP